MYTQLTDRQLWHDGTTVITPDQVMDALTLFGTGFSVTEMTPDIQQYNAVTPKVDAIKVKTQNADILSQWVIPEEFQRIGVNQACIEGFQLRHPNIPEDEQNARYERLVQELHLYRDMNLLPIVRAIIYVINTLSRNNVVWGLGRGSSVSSYVLFLLGLHEVDSFAYDLDVSEFLRTHKD